MQLRNWIRTMLACKILGRVFAATTQLAGGKQGKQEELPTLVQVRPVLPNKTNLGEGLPIGARSVSSVNRHFAKDKNGRLLYVTNS